MRNRPRYTKSYSTPPEPQDLYMAIVTRIEGDDVYVKVPRLTQEFEHGPIVYTGSPGEAGDQLLVGFLEGDRDAIVGVFPGSGGGNFPIENTVLVAASDTRQAIKDMADYVCDGVTDAATIRAACLSVDPTQSHVHGNNGGRVVLAAGTYNVVSDYNQQPLVSTNVILEGEGPGTKIVPTLGTKGPFNYVFQILGEGLIRKMRFDLSSINTTNFAAIDVSSVNAMVEDCVFAGLATNPQTGNFYVDSSDSSFTGADGFGVRNCEFYDFEPSTDLDPDDFAAVRTRGMHVYDSKFMPGNGIGFGGMNPTIMPWAISVFVASAVTITGNQFFGSAIHVWNSWGTQINSNRFYFDNFTGSAVPDKPFVHVFHNDQSGTPYFSTQINSNWFLWNHEIAEVQGPEYPQVLLEADPASTVPMASVTLDRNAFYHGCVGIAEDFATEQLTVSNNEFAGSIGVHRSGVNLNMNTIEIKQLTVTSNFASDSYSSLILANPEPFRQDFGYGLVNLGKADLGNVNITSNMLVVGDKTPYHYSGYGLFSCELPDRATATHRPNFNISYNMVLSPYGSQPYNDTYNTSMSELDNPVPGSMSSVVGNFWTNVDHGSTRGVETLMYKANMFPAADQSYELLNGRIDFAWSTPNTAPLYLDIDDNYFAHQKDYAIRARVNRAGAMTGNLMAFRQSFTNPEAVQLAGDGQWHVADNTVNDPPNDFWGTSYLKQSGIEAQGTQVVSSFNGTDADVYSASFSPSNMKYLHRRQIETGIPGDLTTGSGTKRIPIATDRRILYIGASVNTAPTGSDIVIDVNVNGTTMFPTATKPTISAGDNYSDLWVPDTTDLSDGDYLTIDVDQVGSSTAGSDMTVIIYWVPIP